MLDSTVVALALPCIRHDLDASGAGPAVGDERLPADDRGAGRHRRAARRHVRPQARLPRRDRPLRRSARSSPAPPSGEDADRRPRPAGRRRRADADALLAIVCNAFPAEEQPRALGIWAAVSAIALAIGPLAGGALIEIDWRVIFWINLPVAALGVAIMAVAAPESTDPGAGTQDRLPGLAALSAGLTAVVLALVQSQAWSGGPVAALGLLGVASLLRLLADRAAGPRPDRRIRPLPQRALLRRQRRRLRHRRLLLGGDVLPAPVPAGRARPLGVAARPADPADHRADGLHLALLRAPDRAASAPAA